MQFKDKLFNNELCYHAVSDNVLQAERLNIQLGSLTLARDMSFRLQPGQVTAILGSSLVNCLKKDGGGISCCSFEGGGRPQKK